MSCFVLKQAYEKGEQFPYYTEADLLFYVGRI